MLPFWKLLGFVLYVVMYFIVLDAVHQMPAESTTTVLFKLLPMAHLVFIVISSAGDGESVKDKPYRRAVLFGLVMSMVGDVLLVYEKHFLVGVVFFAVAQASYCKAFGFRPLGSGPLAVSFYVVGIGVFAYLVPLIRDGAAMQVVVGLYMALIFTMAWRAAALQFNHPSVDNACACIGAMLFILSDFMLAVGKWDGPFVLWPLLVMLTYYGGQLGIALSASNRTISMQHKVLDDKRR